MNRPPRPGFIIAFLVATLLASAATTYTFLQGVLSNRLSAVRRAERRQKKRIFPVQEECAETASQPLLEVIRHLDYSHDPNALLVFDLAMQTRLRKGHYEELDACAATLERTQARFPNGGWQLYRMIDTLSECPGGPAQPDEAWRLHLDRLHEWMLQHPESFPAREALAGAIRNYAWKARGEGFANTVTAEGWRLFSDRLQQASSILQGGPADLHHSPMWYYTSLSVDRELSRPREEYDRIFQEGIARTPGFFGFYTEKAYALLPRWNGQPGDWERFAKDVSDAKGGQDGDALYFYIVRSQCESIGNKDVLGDDLLDWPRVKRGWVALCTTYGNTNNNLNEYCLMAGMKGDREETLLLLDQIKGQWDPWTWKTRAIFDDFQDWAFRRGAYRSSAPVAWIPPRR